MDDYLRSSRRASAAGGSAAADPSRAGRPQRARSRRRAGWTGWSASFARAASSAEVDSWISTGVERARRSPAARPGARPRHGPAAVGRIRASMSGALLPLLAMFLPQIIDMLTKNGSTPAGGLDRRWLVDAGPWRPARRIARGYPRLADTRAVDKGRHRRPRRMSMPIRDRRPRSAATASPMLRAWTPTTLAADRVRRFLETEPVLWLSSTPRRRRAAPGPILVRLGRRDHRDGLQARGRQGPQPARRSARDARPR